MDWAAGWLRWAPGMSSTEIAAMTAPTALMRKAILKPALSGRPLPRTCVAMMVPATCAPTDELVERAHRTGELRPEIDSLDLLVVLSMLAGVAAAPELSPDRVRRYVDLVVHGLGPD